MLDALPWNLTVYAAGLGSAAAQASAEDSSKRARAILFAISLPHFLGLGSSQYDRGGHAHPCISVEERGAGY